MGCAIRKKIVKVIPKEKRAVSLKKGNGNSRTQAHVDWAGCDVEAVHKGDGEYTVSVFGFDGNVRELLLRVDVPPLGDRGRAQTWKSVHWGGLLIRKLMAEVSKNEQKIRAERRTLVRR